MLTLELSATGSITITGRLDAAQADTAQKYLDTQVGTVVLDCSRLDYISSAGLGVLLKTQKRLLANNGKLRLIAVNRHISDIFQYSGFDTILEIESAPE